MIRAVIQCTSAKRRKDGVRETDPFESSDLDFVDRVVGMQDRLILTEREQTSDVKEYSTAFSSTGYTRQLSHLFVESLVSSCVESPHRNRTNPSVEVLIVPDSSPTSTNSSSLPTQSEQLTLDPVLDSPVPPLIWQLEQLPSIRSSRPPRPQ